MTSLKLFRAKIFRHKEAHKEKKNSILAYLEKSNQNKCKIPTPKQRQLLSLIEIKITEGVILRCRYRKEFYETIIRGPLYALNILLF